MHGVGRTILAPPVGESAHRTLPVPVSLGEHVINPLSFRATAHALLTF